MVLTQWAFLGPVLLWPQGLGLPLEGEEEGLEGLVAILGEVGRHLGVREELNLCNGGVQGARAYSKLLLEREILPHLTKPFPLAEDMAGHMMAGVAILNPFIQPVAFRAWAWRLMGVKEEQEHLEGSSWLLYTLQGVVFDKWLHQPVLGCLLRPLANKMMTLNIFLASEWEDWVVQRVHDGPLLPYPLHVAEAFLFIPVLVIVSSVKALRDIRKRTLFITIVIMNSMFFYLNLRN